MIVEKLNKAKNQKIYVYQAIDDTEKKKLFDEIVSTFNDYATANGFHQEDIQFDFKLLNEINIRVDKRKDYCIIYHDETYLNEVREAALLAYWILKFQPFLIVSETEGDYNFNINCGFAAYVIFSVVSEYIERKSKGKEKLYLTEKYVKKFVYALKYWDLSKESLMLIAETMCGTTKKK